MHLHDLAYFHFNCEFLKSGQRFLSIFFKIKCNGFYTNVRWQPLLNRLKSTKFTRLSFRCYSAKVLTKQMGKFSLHWPNIQQRVEVHMIKLFYKCGMSSFTYEPHILNVCQRKWVWRRNFNCKGTRTTPLFVHLTTDLSLALSGSLWLYRSSKFTKNVVL